LWLFCLSAVAAEPETKPRLKISDPAPPLQVSKWIQGDPVKAFKKGEIYIVEFWGSFCGPCKIYVPELNKIHLQYEGKGITVIGVAVREDDPKDAIKFLRSMGTNMTYRVAIDDMSSGKGFMDQRWLDAAEREALPITFVIEQNGLIAYIGHPNGLKGSLLPDLLARKYDLKAASAAYEKQRDNEPKIKQLEADFEKAKIAKDWEKAEETVNARSELILEEDRPTLEMDRLIIKIRKNDWAAAEKIAGDLLKDKGVMQNFFDAFAWNIAIEDKVTPKLLEIAYRAAEKANLLEQGKDPSILETLARLQFLRGDKAGAIATQEKAIAAVPETETVRGKQRYQMALEAYRAGELPK
jgi:thiol-disulfide isomerase/thioredoxin